MPTPYKITTGGKTKSYSSFNSAYKATRPNIIQRAMVKLSTMGKAQRNYGVRIVHAASNKNEMLRKAGMK